jgi:hypothetical protein
LKQIKIKKYKIKASFRAGGIPGVGMSPFCILPHPVSIKMNGKVKREIGLKLRNIIQ